MITGRALAGLFAVYTLFVHLVLMYTYRQKIECPKALPLLVSVDAYSLAAEAGTFTVRTGVSTQAAAYQAAKAVLADSSDAHGPTVVFVQQGAVLEHFLSLVGSRHTRPFVLVAVDGDAPFDRSLQERVGTIQGLRACYATNMEAPTTPHKFHAMPVGLAFHQTQHYSLWYPIPLTLKYRFPVYTADGGVFEGAIRRAVAMAPPFAKRKKQVLMASMSDSSQPRREIRALLRKPEFAHLVHIVDERLSITRLLTLIGEYQAVLSPPGVGYDCFRTWESLAMGSVPIVVRDEAFDLRHIEAAGAVFAPKDALTPRKLEALLGGLSDPRAKAMSILGISEWQSRWWSHLNRDG